ncbi:MAG: hypothetical protein CML13_06795 [Puniceicoccaceae bacterium]|nr:hypothetical protein [Puniceicoccaceae bacterium]|tara:strand:- start:14334 stop:15347 length:1014 start_codon:yes stop_codon:yes gene_type:complete
MKTRILILGTAVTLAALFTGCSNVERSLIFTTGTTIGLEISASTTETQPVKVIVGYKRLETVLNPVYDKDGIALPGGTKETISEAITEIVYGNSDVEKYRPEAYSVIGKFVGSSAGNGKGSGTVTAEGSISAAQWFATGEAAKTLAKQPGIAGAISGSSLIAKEAAEQEAARYRGVEAFGHDASLLLIGEIYTLLKGKQDSRAKEIVARLDSLGDTLVPKLYDFNAYEKNGTKVERSAVAQQYFPTRSSKFTKVADYNRKLIDSVAALEESIGNAATWTIDFGDGTTQQLANNIVRARVEEIRSEQKKLLDAFEKKFSENKVVVEARDLFIEYIRGE